MAPTPDPLADLARRGFARWPDLLPPGLVSDSCLAAQAIYDRAERWLARTGPRFEVTPLPAEVAPGARYAPTADSVSLDALGPRMPAIWAAAERALAPVFAAEFGPAMPARLSEHAWLRRQHPPGRRTPRAPHAWHQDGGLGFDYLAGDPGAADALLPMITAWVPLTACGRDRPGLQLDPRRREALIPLERLAAEAGRAAPRVEAPALAAGEAVVMHGGTLHATGPCAADGAARISVELRWLPAGGAGRLGGMARG